MMPCSNCVAQHIHLGTYTIEEDAATAFDKAALIVRGTKAKVRCCCAQKTHRQHT